MENNLDLIPFLAEFERLLTQNKNVLIAIDGGCATGKSTLAEKISKIHPCNIIHTDDFFLPPYLRTEKRFLTAGGNVHYERLNETILQLGSNMAFSYQVFDCSIMDYNGTKEIDPLLPTIIEGVYSIHPAINAVFDIKIFLQADYNLRLERILKRNGQTMQTRFINEWIPLEDAYLQTFSIKENCDFLLNT